MRNGARDLSARPDAGETPINGYGNIDEYCRIHIRPVPRPACEYNEHLSNALPVVLATTHRTGIADAARHPGIDQKMYAPVLTIQDFMRPAMARGSANGVR